MAPDPANVPDSQHWPEVARVFGKLGVAAFGGPAAHVAMMHEELVRRRRWVEEEEFVDMVSMTHLIPGPNSTELAIHLGHRRAGWRGLLAAGFCFILPAFFMVLALAWAYVEYGALPEAKWLLYGVKPVVVAVILHAIWGLRSIVASDHWLLGLAVGTIILALLGVHELILLLGLGVGYSLTRGLFGPRQGPGARRLGRSRDGSSQRDGSGQEGRSPPGGKQRQGPGRFAALALAGLPIGFSVGLLGHIFWVFFKIGAVLYGSGYVLVAFLRGDVVERLGWITQAQLLDAVSIGQLTPGPVFTTATFIGYLVDGTPGAIVATVGIFAPGFVFVALLKPLAAQARRHASFGRFLKGANAAALGLMAAIVLQLGGAAVVDTATLSLAALAWLLLARGVSSVWLILGAAVLGLAFGQLASL